MIAAGTDETKMNLISRAKSLQSCIIRIDIYLRLSPRTKNLSSVVPGPKRRTQKGFAPPRKISSIWNHFPAAKVFLLFHLNFPLDWSRKLPGSTSNQTWVESTIILISLHAVNLKRSPMKSASKSLVWIWVTFFQLAMLVFYSNTTKSKLPPTPNSCYSQ